MTKASPALLADVTLAGVVEEITRKLEAGEPIELAEYPEHFELLSQILPALEVLVLMGREASAPTEDAQHAEAGLENQGGRLGDFRLLHELGRGGMGIVYEAEQISLRRRVALKVLPYAAMLDERALARFHNEARAAATLFHPHIVPTFFVGNERGVHFYAMQLINGSSVAEVLARIRTAETTRRQGDGEQASAALSDLKAASRESMAEDALSTIRTESPARYLRAIARMGAECTEALSHAHHHGIIHRDIKPGNLLRAPSRQ
jgi:hypothetical protein